jgi:Divergent InlB B-repeat domain
LLLEVAGALSLFGVSDQPLWMSGTAVVLRWHAKRLAKGGAGIIVAMRETSTGGGLWRKFGGFRSAVPALLATCGLLLVPSLASAASITGTVTDVSTDLPLEGINVCAYGDASTHCGMTEPAGDYIIAGLTEGSYKVGFSSIDHIYLTQFYNGKDSQAEADPVSVTEGATTSGIDAAMQEGGKITGEVTAAFDGAPIKGINACALEAGGAGSLVSCAQADASGEYTIPGLVGGSYKVKFSPGFCFGCGSQNYLTQFYAGKDSWAEADPVSVTVGATTSGIDAQMISVNTLAVSLAGTGSGTVTSSPAGISCGSSCSHAFTMGSSVVLTAVPSAGSSFAGWSGGCSGTGACDVTLEGDIAVTATFNGGGGGGTPEPTPPPTPAPPPGPKPKTPNTKIVEAVIDSAKRRATFRFRAIGSSTGFQCALIKKHKRPRFKNCRSPKTYKKLKPGAYTFKVRSVGPGGSDASPARTKFRIR